MNIKRSLNVVVLRLLSFALLFLAMMTEVGFSQNPPYSITKGQYWIDSPSNGVTDVTPSSQNSIDSTKWNFSNIQVNYSGLSAGTHTLYFRVQSSDNIWGQPQFVLFTVGALGVKAALNGGEYWIDNNTSSATSFVPTTFNSDSTLATLTSKAVTFSGLSAGEHKLSIRFQALDGTWSQPQSAVFTVGTLPTPTKIVSGEYWIDNITSSATSFVPTTFNADSTLATLTNKAVAFSGLSAGEHKISVRFVSIDGVWSQPQSAVFTVGTLPTPTKIVSGEYWIDNNTGSATSFTPTSFNADSTLVTLTNKAVIFSNLSFGSHTLSLRFKSVEGVWGQPSITTFIVINLPTPTKIVSGEYWIDDNTSSATSFTPTSFNSDSTIATLTNRAVNYSGLSDGDHKLSLRFKSVEGVWGQVQSVKFTVGTIPGRRYITKGEYWIDSRANGTTEFTPDIVPNTDTTKVTKTIAIKLATGLPDGLHTLWVRFQDENGYWGQTQMVVFTQDAGSAPPVIAAGEYWFDNDPGRGNGKPVPPSKAIFGSSTVTYTDSISLPGLSPRLAIGAHTYGIRFQNDRGEWGDPATRGFTIQVRPTIVASTDSVKFGSVNIGDSLSMGFSVTNSGDDTLKVTGMSFGSSIGYTVKPTTGTILPATGGKLDFTVTFRPTGSEGSRNTTLNIANNDAPKTIQIVGFAHLRKPLLTYTPDTLNFGNVVVGDSVTRVLAVRNAGDDSLKITSVSVATSFMVDYHIVPTGGAIRPNSQDSVLFYVSLAPKSAGSKSTTLTIISNDVTKQVVINGAGVTNPTPTLALSTSSLKFGPVLVGKDSTLTFDIKNLGSQALTISGVSSNTAEFSIKNPPTFPLTINISQPKTITVKFTPIAFVQYSGKITVTSSNAPSNPVQFVDLTGEGSAGPAVLAVAQDSIDFGNVTKDSSSIQLLTIKNSGGSSLSITGLSASTTIFSVMNAPSLYSPAIISPDSSKNFNVKFAPDVVGLLSSVLTITSNAPANPVKTLKLKGKGVSGPTPNVFLSAGVMDFGDVKVNTQKRLSIAIKNSGNASLVVNGIVPSNTTVYQVVSSTGLTLTPNQTDSIRVAFSPTAEGSFDGSLTIYSNTDPSVLPLKGKGFRLNVGFDSTATPPAVTADAGVTLNISPSGSLGPNGFARLFYKQGGAAIYDSLEMVRVGNSYTGQVPASVVNLRGVSYYFKISDGLDVRTSPPSNPESSPFTVVVSVPTGTQKSQDQPAGKAQNYYRMVSVPLDGISGSTDSILSDFGTYDVTKWRLFRYQSGAYVEHNAAGFQPVAPGRGYWFITSNAGKIKSGAGKTAKTNHSFSIDLQPEWNQIGSPFGFTVAWNDVTGKGAHIGPIYSYNGSDYEIVSFLRPWEGYFVKNSSANPVTIYIPPIETPAGSSKPILAPYGKLQSGEWFVQITAASGLVTDRTNFAGVLQNAQDEFDANDIEESPRQPGEFLKLQFNHTDWKERPDVYAFDFKKVQPGGQVWDFEVLTTSSDKSVKISFEQLQSVPSDYQIILFDKSRKSAHDIRQHAEYDFPTSNGKELKQDFRLVIGSKEFIEKNNLGINVLPQQYALSQNYPNPFNPTTMAQYSIPIKSYVEVKIYNLIGNEIAVLAREDREPGYYAIHWDGMTSIGQRASSGTYFMRLSARSLDGSNRTSIQTIKMILIK
jgi:hypothetical protein